LVKVRVLFSFIRLLGVKWRSKCFYVHNALKTEGKCMLTQHRKTRFLSQIILIATLLSTVAVTVPTAPIVSGQEATILSVNGLNGLNKTTPDPISKPWKALACTADTTSLIKI
jgi:hypothetical protein